MEKKFLRRALDKKVKYLRDIEIETPPQGWIKAIRESLGMTTCQLAKRMNVSQPRIVNIEKNESNLKISTLKMVAKALNCRLIYAIVPKDTLVNIVKNRAKEKAQMLLKDVNINMALENQLEETEDVLDICVQEILNDKISCLWSDK